MAEVIKSFKNNETKAIIDVNASTLTALKKRAELLAEIYNDAVQNGNYGARIEVASIDGESTTEESLRDYMEQTVNTYTKVAKTACFDRLKAKRDPMLEAIKQLEFGTIRIADKKIGEDKIPVTSIEPTIRFIDLDQLDKHCGGIGNEKGQAWKGKVKSFVIAMAARVALDHGLPEWQLSQISDSYAMLDIVSRLKNGEDVTSDEKLIEAMSAAAVAMVGDKYDVGNIQMLLWVRDCFTKKSTKAALKLICGNFNNMCSIMMDILNHVITGRPFSGDFKKIIK